MMPLDRRNLLPSSRIRGFSLLEMAIVLGIIGAIVGSLIGLFSVMQYRTQVNRAVDEVGIIATNVRSYYNGQAVPSATKCPNTNFTANYNQFGVYPSEMVAGAVANNPWNLGSAAGTAQVDLCSANPVQFIVRFTNLTAKACAEVVVKTSEVASGMNLQQIVVTIGGAPQTFNTIPSYTTSNATGAVDPVAASTACSANGATVDWYYQLSG